MHVARGHRLRDRDFPPPDGLRRVNTLIIGGGISGLAAAWQLSRAGQSDFLVLEMDDTPGGNSRAGQSSVSAYPWGAHYLPLPGPEAELVRSLLAELGVLQGDSGSERPLYDEQYLCAAPQERLFRHGLWEEGLLAQRGIDREERDEQQRFQAQMAAFKRLRGGDGRRVFAIPMALASRDPVYLALDRLSFKQWLLAENYRSPTVHWLANYACRDDYGTHYAQTSAWAGLHYFACRNGMAANAAPDCVLTRPDGNAWLMRGLLRHAEGRIETGAMAVRLEVGKHDVAVDVLQQGRVTRYYCRRLIWAAPLFVLPRVWVNPPEFVQALSSSMSYAPWLVANLHLERPPEEKHGEAPAWDNVLYDSPALGYVIATHQHIRRHLRGASVWTYYRALEHQAPAEARQHLLASSREFWVEQILADLEKAHPDIRGVTTRLDVFRNGHAMARPTVGALFSEQRQRIQSFSHPRIALAHADLSGFSLFEEAQYRGVLAARQLMGAKLA